MLKFLRTHQKLFFIITTVAITITFCFFGTHSTMEKTQTRKDHKIATALDGSSLMQSEIDSLSYLLSLDADSHFYERRGLLLNGNIITKDFFKNKLAHLLVAKYLNELKPALEKPFQQAIKYKTYEHPQSALISQRGVYEQFYPQMAELLAQMKSQKELSLTSFDLLTQLYLAQKTFTPYALKRLLIFQQSQYPEVQSDPYIYQNDMLLFGFREFKDWFSKDFIDLISQFILNVAAVAEEKGFSISEKEAKENLNSHLFSNFKNQQNQQNTSQHKNNQVAKQKQDLPPVDFYKTQLRLIGMGEKMLLKTWRQILLFQQYMQATASAVVIDPLLHKDLAEFTQEKVTVAVYSLSEALRLKSLEEYAALMVYSEALYGTSDLVKNPALNISEKAFSEVEKNTPELIRHSFRVVLQKIQVSDLLLKIGERKLWDWQTQKENFALLQKEFKELALLASGKSNTVEEIFYCLESLEPALRLKIDAFSRKLIIKKDSELIKNALFAAKKEELTLNLPAKGGKTVLNGLSNAKLLTLCQTALKAENKDLKAQEMLSFLTEDEESYYSISVQEKLGKEYFTFQAALSEGGLKDLVDDFLQEKQKQSAYRDLSFADVKADLLKALYLSSHENDKNLEKQFLQDYKTAYLTKIREELKKGADEKLYLAQSNSSTLRDQFKLTKEIKILSRASEESWLKKSLFSGGKIPAYSEINNGQLAFFVFLKKEIAPDVEEVDNLRKTLENEAVLNTAEKLLEQIKTQKALVLPVRQIVNEDS